MNRVKLLWWAVTDRFNAPHPDVMTMSWQRVNREIKDQVQSHHDEASVKCMARVKRRMLLGALCPDAPIVSRRER